MVVFQKLEETSEPPKLVTPQGPTDHQPAKEKPFGKVTRFKCRHFAHVCPVLK